jgi:RNA polymerase sigma-70 factor (ECF subfamily)
MPGRRRKKTEVNRTDRRSAPNDLDDEAALVERARTDRRAFGDLYERYVGRIYSYLYYRVGNRQDAEDLTARVFVQALTHLPEFDAQGGSFSGWLFTIAHNLAANWFRDRARRPSAPLEDVDEPEEPSDAYRQVVDNETIRTMLAGLPAERQHLLLLRYVQDLSHAEIARLLGRSEGAVRVLLHRTLQALREELGDAADSLMDA